MALAVRASSSNDFPECGHVSVGVGSARELHEALALARLDHAPRNLGDRGGVQRTEAQVLERRHHRGGAGGEVKVDVEDRDLAKPAQAQNVGGGRGGVQVAVAAQPRWSGVVAGGTAQGVGVALALEDRVGSADRGAGALEGGAHDTRPHGAIGRQPGRGPLGHHRRLLRADGAQGLQISTVVQHAENALELLLWTVRNRSPHFRVVYQSAAQLGGAPLVVAALHHVSVAVEDVGGAGTLGAAGGLHLFDQEQLAHCGSPLLFAGRDLLRYGAFPAWLRLKAASACASRSS